MKMDIVALLLAAGRGERFGGAKLAADLDGMPVAHHAAAALSALPFAGRVAVVSPQTPSLVQFGFTEVRLSAPDAPISCSIAAGVAEAERLGADAVLIALADMPLVPRSHFKALIAAFDGRVIGSRAGSLMPPAIFGSKHFPALKSLTGDHGARSLLGDAPFVDLDLKMKTDIDYPADLEETRLLLRTKRSPETTA